MLIKRENTITGSTVVLEDSIKVDLNNYIQKVSSIFNREEEFLNYIINEIPNDTREQKIVNRLLGMLRDISEVRLHDAI